MAEPPRRVACRARQGCASCGAQCGSIRKNGVQAALRAQGWSCWGRRWLKGLILPQPSLGTTACGVCAREPSPRDGSFPGSWPKLSALFPIRCPLPEPESWASSAAGSLQARQGAPCSPCCQSPPLSPAHTVLTWSRAPPPLPRCYTLPCSHGPSPSL